jgi:prolyl oligopeptidase PreP (S9A serine peptidase family)
MIDTKDELYCHALPIIRGLEEAGEDMEKTKAQIIVLGQMLEAGDITPEGVEESLNRTFGKKAVEEARKICALHAEEILTDAKAVEDAVVMCEPCLDEALSSILVEQEGQEENKEKGES